jgi:hypothetical protein
MYTGTTLKERGADWELQRPITGSNLRLFFPPYWLAKATKRFSTLKIRQRV